MIVGLSGYARSGKDTLATFLVKDHGFERIAFADALRDMLYALNPLTTVRDRTERRAYVDYVQDIVDEYGWEWAKENSDIRLLLQRLGTEAGRHVLGENIWVDAAMAKVKPGGRFVFTDVRFPNEAKAIWRAGGQLVRIRRPGFEPVNAHPSETALDGYQFDRIVVNRYELGYLQSAAARLVAAWPDGTLSDQAGTMADPLRREA